MAETETYDAVVVGASFAGLAAAGQLVGAGRILIADREPIGAGETSACATPLAVLERLDALDALEQVCPTLMIHVGAKQFTFRPAYPFATFDYRTLCEILASRLDGVDTVVAALGGVEEDGSLIFGERRVRAKVLIDASGWRRVLAREHGAPSVDRNHLSAGIETRAASRGCSLEFWLRPQGLDRGVHWRFPAGDHTRDGSASYVGETKGLRRELARFEQVDDFPARSVHGGYFPSHFGPVTAEQIFVVGDAAGQCLPLTGEGVRPALVFGQEAGRQARAVLEGTKSLEAALGDYRTAVERSRWAYRRLEHFQSSVLRWPLGVLSPAVRTSSWKPVSRQLEKIYWRVANPDTLEVVSGVRAPTAPSGSCCETGPAVARRSEESAPRWSLLNRGGESRPSVCGGGAKAPVEMTQ